MQRRKSTRRKANTAGPTATLADAAYERIRYQILHGELEPGTLVSERTLAELLDVGKAPIRAAIQRLAAEGFVSLEPRRGIVISSRSVQDITDLFEIRVVLEQHVARQVAGKLKPDQIDQLRANLRQHATYAEADPVAALEVDLEFHRLLCAFHGNTHLVAVLNQLIDSLYPDLCAAVKRFSHRGPEAGGEHQKVVDALILGDAQEAELRVTEHLRHTLYYLVFRGDRGLLGGMRS